MNDIEKAMAAARQGNQLVPELRKASSEDVSKEVGEYLTHDTFEPQRETENASPYIESEQVEDANRGSSGHITSHVESDVPLRKVVAKSQRGNTLVEEEVQHSRLHELPLASLDKLGFITPNTPKNQITEEYRRIKRPLLKRLGRSDDSASTFTNVLAVTSAMSGEGKTYSAINLAMSLAREKDRTVLLIDSDVVRHTAGEVFGVSPNEPGLLDLLDNDTIGPSDVILNTNVERLSFLPAGRKNALASELLSSDSMMRLIDDLSSRYPERIVVMDCPPIMQTTEAAILVDHASQIVFVVAEEQTSQGIVMQALRLIDDEKKVGILLNKSTTHLGHYDYYNYSYS